MSLIGPILVGLGILCLLSFFPIPVLRELSVSIPGLVKIRGPAVFVLIILGAVLWAFGF